MKGFRLSDDGCFSPGWWVLRDHSNKLLALCEMWPMAGTSEYEFAYRLYVPHDPERRMWGVLKHRAGKGAYQRCTPEEALIYRARIRLGAQI